LERTEAFRRSPKASIREACLQMSGAEVVIRMALDHCTGL
jgi:hypothetical protein